MLLVISKSVRTSVCIKGFRIQNRLSHIHLRASLQCQPPISGSYLSRPSNHVTNCTNSKHFWQVSVQRFTVYFSTSDFVTPSFVPRDGRAPRLSRLQSSSTKNTSPSHWEPSQTIKSWSMVLHCELCAARADPSPNCCELSQPETIFIS